MQAVQLGLATPAPHWLVGRLRSARPSPLQVSNKVAELLMLRQGCDVCCTTAQDRSAIQRYEEQLRLECGAAPASSAQQ